MRHLVSIPAATIVTIALAIIGVAAHAAQDAGAPPADVDTIFDLASLTKVIATATLAMQAVDAGLVTLDTQVAAIEPRWSAPDRREVTLRHLLDHATLRR